MQKNSFIRIFSFVLLTLVLLGCDKNENQSISKSKASQQMNNNMLSDLSSDDLGDFKWLNKPISFEIESGSIKVLAGKETDFFNNPEDETITSTAPFLYKVVEGNFVATALVRPDFSSLWNAAALMVHIDNSSWIKFAFENSDATGKSIVSVVTKNVSDDANGAILNDEDQIWLKLIRKENVYSMLWSIDGKDYKMTRLSAMPYVDSVKIGIEVQSPVGESATHFIDYFEVVKTTVKDLRQGK